MDTAVALGRGWRTDSTLDKLLMGLLSLFVLALAATSMTARSRSFLERNWAKFQLCVVSLACSWIVAEGLLLGPFSSQVYAKTRTSLPHLQKVFHPLDNVMPGIEGESHYSTNSLGIRGPEMPSRQSAFRILCIGGSTTICTYLDDVETWPNLLMERLNAGSSGNKNWVGNVGINGHSSAHHLELVNHSALVDQMDLVIVLAGINDFTYALLGRTHALSDDLEDSSFQWQPIWHHSRVLSLIQTFVRRFRSSSRIWVEDGAGKMYVERRRLRQAAVLVDELPPLESALDAYEQRLRAIVAAVAAKNVRLVLLTQPTIWSEDLREEAQSLLWLGKLSEGRYLSLPPLMAGIALFNDRLTKVGRETGTPVIDLTSLNGHEEFFYDDCHFNEAGAREVARLVADHEDAFSK
ncbi:MAG: SGNH/GDSL hydrolase family protein [Planctomycetales bacterium]